MGSDALAHSNAGLDESVQWKLQLEPDGAATNWSSGSRSHNPKTKCCCENLRLNGVEFWRINRGLKKRIFTFFKKLWKNQSWKYVDEIHITVKCSYRNLEIREHSSFFNFYLLNKGLLILFIKQGPSIFVLLISYQSLIINDMSWRCLKILIV